MSCPYLIELAVERRPRNALNIEIGTPVCRCQLKPPKEWKDKDMAYRWLGSGGSPFVFRACTPQKCPLVIAKE